MTYKVYLIGQVVTVRNCVDEEHAVRKLQAASGGAVDYWKVEEVAA
jgi:hypothetical protein